MILLPHSSQCWYYRRVPPRLVFAVVVFYFQIGSHYLGQAGFELKTLLVPQHPGYWDYRSAPPHQDTVVVVVVVVVCLFVCLLSF